MARYENLLSSRAAEFAFGGHGQLIDGRWLPAISGETIDVIDPATGRVFANVPAGGAADIDKAVAAARRAFTKGPWQRIAPAERGRLIWRLADRIEELTEEFAQLESLDSGKPVQQARTIDIPETVARFRYMAGWAGKINGETITPLAPGEYHAYTVRRPIGVVGQIIPWNFPLVMAAYKLAPALAAGCTIVLKPAEQTPLTALRLGRLMAEVGFPDGVLNIVTGYGETAGAALVAHGGVDKIAFTGSTEIGKIIAKTAANNLTPVSLELGGKSPVVVFRDADLDCAIPGAAAAIFFNQGQTCTAGSRLFAHRAIHDQLVEGIEREVRKLRVGPGLDPATTLGPLVSAEHLARVQSYIDLGRSEGAEIVSDNLVQPGEGYFIAPTLMVNATPEMRVSREEIFGPVLCVTSFEDDDLDAIAAKANATEYGLAASVWTRDLATAHRMAARIDAGTVWINTHNHFDPSLAFGGVKQSGWGRESGFHALELYSTVKAVLASLT
jgi:phenylacetaldehyde dehydrogenase